MERVKLGAVFVNYCRSDLLFEAISSLETAHLLKLFIVDRAGSTAAAVPSLAAGWNRGIEAALAWGADWVLVSCDDVVFHPCTADHLVERAGARGYGFLSPFNVARLGLRASDLAALPAPPDGRDEQAADYSCFLLAPELFREIGPFDELFAPAYYEDADYNLRLGLSGKAGMLTSYAPFLHYGGASGGLRTELARKNRDYFIAKWKEAVPWVEAFATTGGVVHADPGSAQTT
jgi:GT2 family glycosyltransferase